jgi:glycosyltransferase involved in cell wall biosynthesis
VRVPHALVPRRAWPDDRYPHWAVAALRAAGARVSDHGLRCDLAVLPAAGAVAIPRMRAARVIGLVDKPARPWEERLPVADVVATSEALAVGWEDARVVRPAVPPGSAGDADDGGVLRLASVGPLHWSAGHEHAVAAAARLLAGGIEVELRVVGTGPGRDAILFTAFDLGIEHAVTVVAADERAETIRADVVVVAAVEDRAWTGLLHALACGVPVAATDLPTARELGVPVLVPPRDPAALVGAINRREPGPPSVTDLEACGRALLE